MYIARCRSVFLSAEVCFGTSAEMSGQFGTGAEVSYGYFGTSAEMSWVRSVLGPKCLDTLSVTVEISCHLVGLLREENNALFADLRHVT